MRRNDSLALCAERGWGVGTELTGTDPYGTKTIQITYMSDQILLARNVHDGRESTWSLTCRTWEELAK